MTSNYNEMKNDKWKMENGKWKMIRFQNTVLAQG